MYKSLIIITLCVTIAVVSLLALASVAARHDLIRSPEAESHSKK